MSELLWVAVPDGLRPSGKASIRVLVVPRLAAGSISDFGLDDWPSTLTGDAGFQLRTRTSAGEAIATHRIEHVARARSDVWTAFFGGDAGLLNEWEHKTVPPPMVSQTCHDAREAATTYRAVTRKGAQNDPAATDAVIRTEIAGWAAPLPAAPPPVAEPPAHVPPDFHRTVSTLREHPAVLLELGLVFELLVDVADLGLGTSTGGRALSVRCVDPPFLRALVTSPWTRYELTGAVFRPAPAQGTTSGIRAGVLDLSDSRSLTDPTAPPEPRRWAISTFDVDGVVGGLRQAAHDNAKNPPVHATMPSIRSAGFALLRPGRHADFAHRMRLGDLHRAADSMADAELTADDLVLGYRVDVRREGSAWRSVCERDVTYRVNGLAISAGREEGHVKPFAAVRGADGVLRADEVVLRWDGWNLALPRPNLRGDTPGPARNPEHPLPFDFDWDFEIPRGRLPALRFADRYQLRVRVADLAGGGLGLTDLQGNTAASASVTYRRHDPVQPPVLRGPATFAAGAALDRLVVRSDRDRTPDQLHADDPDYPLTESRELHPPTVSFGLVEQHRVLDALTDEQSFALAQQAMHADAAGSGLPDPVANGVMAHVPKAPGGPPAPLGDDRDWVPRWPERRPKKVTLAAHTDPSVPVTLRWRDAGTLELTLAKAEQAVVELSSTIDGELENHLAIQDFLANPPISPDDTKRGRNPVVTPPRRILVVHAVKRPLVDPRWDTPLAVTRAHHDTTAVLNPVFPRSGLDTDSTGRLDVAAAWTEFEDVGAQAGPGQRQVVVEHLHSETIARSDDQVTRLAVRHEFGDTKHRRVTYTLNAISRFREYFKESELDSAFEARLPQGPVNVLSSARPSAPAVLAVTPAFRRQRTRPNADRVEHLRLGQLLRVELERPWYETGEGEQLAVVVGPGAGTRMGRDPLFGTPSVVTVTPADWFRTPGAVTRLTLPETGQQVTVVPYPVSPGGDRWHADVELSPPPTGQSYHPFVSLAVARYQPDSIQGLQLSTVVVADTVPLLPDRRVVVDRNGTQVRVTVSGVSPEPLNRLEVVLESCPAGVDAEALDLVSDDPAVSAWRKVTAVTRAVDGAIPLITLPPPSGRLRLRLCESENLAGVASADTPKELGQRNVFVDTVLLPAEWRP
ncbi:hypothetical protein [Lentzea sp.]|uniref:hypothetical protein n=1 Tax=Lentzea sp. TaxID=56099 RepID=UPI002C04013E|nr:hypothetical protein [Lentzea sp.]HUQ54796.1 hypothetical protein [Lentzea sp.]